MIIEEEEITRLTSLLRKSVYHADEVVVYSYGEAEVTMGRSSHNTVNFAALAEDFDLSSVEIERTWAGYGSRDEAVDISLWVRGARETFGSENA